jgi:TPR repeat protein
MRTLGQSLLVAVLLAVGMGTLACQTDVEWLRARAKQGDADVQYRLGTMYRNGFGVPQNDAEAIKWFRMAAEQGVAAAQYNLGTMYANGEGVPQDDLQAHMWVNLAASTSQGETNERYAKPRKMIAENMTSAQIAEAQRLAREWKPKTWDELKQGL